MLPRRASAGEQAAPRRMIAVMATMGILPQFFFPQKDGDGYESTPYLSLIEAYRNQNGFFGRFTSRHRWRAIRRTLPS